MRAFCLVIFFAHVHKTLYHFIASNFLVYPKGERIISEITVCPSGCLSRAHRRCTYTLRVKKHDTKLLPITSSNINRFSIFFTEELSSKFATNSYLNIPQMSLHYLVKYTNVRSEKWRQSEICIVINDEPQGSIGKHLRCNVTLLHIYHSIWRWKDF